MQKNTNIPSLVRPLSPAAQFQELNESLAAQVQDTRRNLLGMLDKGRSTGISSSNDVESAKSDGIASARSSLDDDVGDECIRIYLRIRPFKTNELLKNENMNCFEVKSSTAIVAHPPPESNTYKNQVLLHGPDEKEHRFTFSNVFADKTNQKQFFEQTAQERVKNFVNGQDGLIFSYGVTNGGKTYTFQGTDEQPGLIPRSLDLMFQLVKDRLVQSPDVMPRMFNDYEIFDQKRRQEMVDLKASLWKFLDAEEVELFSNNATVGTRDTYYTAAANSLGSSLSSFHSADDGSVRIDQFASSVLSTDNYRCSIWVSFCEIYNEKVYDLLVPVTGLAKAKDRPTLKVSEDKQANVFVKGAHEFFVTSVEEALKLLLVGRRNLQIAATKLNYNSSRSHCIYSIRLLKEFIRSEGLPVHHISRLSFCDLAGSERTSKIQDAGQACGERIKETGSINTSLLTLGRCMTTLRWNQNHRDRPQIIPYRESKLTRLFQHYLSGRAKACMVVNINQCASYFDETFHVLKFSAVAKEVKSVKDLTLPDGLSAIVNPLPPPKFSLLLNQFRDKKRTIGWASTDQSSDIATASNRSLIEPLPEDDDEEAGEDILDKTLDENNEIIQQYISIIEDLKKKLIAERQKNHLLEIEIREEVCNEYGKIFHEMEQHYKEDKQEAVADAEQLAAERMDLFVQSVNQRRKTEGRVTMADTDNDDEEDAWIPVETYQAKEKECEDLRKDIEGLKKELEKMASASNTSSGTSKEIVVLQMELEKKEQKISDLKGYVEEAGKVYQDQQEKLELLEKTNDQLQKALDSKMNAKNDSDAKSGELDEKFASLQKCEESTSSEAKPMDVDTATTGASSESDEGFKLIELESKIFELEGSLETSTKRTDALQRQYDESLAKQRDLSRQLIDTENKLRELAAADGKVADLEMEVGKLKSNERKLQDENDRLSTNIREKESALNSLRAQLEEHESKVKDLDNDLRTSKERFDSLSAQKDAVEGTLRQNLEKLLELQKKIKENEKAITEINIDRDRLVADYEQRLKELGSTVSVAESEAASLRQSIQQLQTDSNMDKQKVADLEQQLEVLREKATKLESEKTDAIEQYESEKTNWATERTSLLNESSQFGDVEAENGRLKTQIQELQEKLDQQHRGSLEEGNKWRLELQETKTSLVNTKKEKLDLMETSKRMDEECKRLARIVEAKEQELKKEKDFNAAITSKLTNSEHAIQSYKVAVQEMDATTGKYEEMLAKKRQELESYQKEIQELREKYATMEKDLILEQKKCLRLKSEVDLKTELESKLKGDLNLIQTKLNEACHELEVLRKEKADVQTILQESQAKADEIQGLKSANDFLRNANEKLSKELQAMEGRLTTARKQASEFQQIAQAKQVEIEELNRNGEEFRKNLEQLQVRFRNAEDERSSLVETVRQLKAENEKLGSSRASSATGGRKKAKATSDNDNADQVEVTPMASKPQKGGSPRKKNADDTMIEEAPSDTELPPAVKTTRPGRGRGATRTRKVTDEESDTKSFVSVSTVAKGAASKVTTARGRRKANDSKEMEDATSTFLRLVDTSPDVLLSNTGRPQRRAAQVASDGIAAISAWNSRDASTVANADQEGPGPSKANDAVLPVKRRRQLLKDPTEPQCSPAQDEEEQAKARSNTATGIIDAVLKKPNTKAKK